MAGYVPARAGGLALGDRRRRRRGRHLRLDPVLSAILAFGPKPDRADSLSASTRTSARRPVLSIVRAPRRHRDQEPVLVERNGGPASRARVVHATWFATRARAEADLVGALQDAMTVQGHTVALDSCRPKRRRLAESLLAEISRHAHDRGDPAGLRPEGAPGAPRRVRQRHGEGTLSGKLAEARSQKQLDASEYF